jgi:hypothetical protein
MYGIFHVAIRDLINTQFSPKVWQKILDSGHFDDGDFLSIKSYEDGLTDRLITTAVQVIGTTHERFLEKLGIFFIAEFSADLRDALTLGSRPGFQVSLLNLPGYIRTVIKAFPGLSAADFTAHQVDNNTFRVVYRSQRRGMAPLVRGLILGLARLYDEKVVLSASELQISPEVNESSYVVVLSQGDDIE